MPTGWFSRNLPVFSIVVTVLGLIVPAPSQASLAVLPALAIMIGATSFTVTTKQLRSILSSKGNVIACLVLGLAVMPVVGLVIGRLYSSETLLQGQVLIGAVAPDVAAPTLVFIAGGNVALAIVVLVLAMLLMPAILPVETQLFGFGNFRVDMTLLTLELVVTIILPVTVGVYANSKLNPRLGSRIEIFPDISSVCYVLLLYVIVSANSVTILGLGQEAIQILALQLLHLLIGVGMGLAYNYATQQREFSAIAFTVGMKEFGLAAGFVFASSWPWQATIPSIFYGIVQMILAPVIARPMLRKV